MHPIQTQIFPDFAPTKPLNEYAVRLDDDGPEINLGELCDSLLDVEPDYLAEFVTTYGGRQLLPDDLDAFLAARGKTYNPDGPVIRYRYIGPGRVCEDRDAQMYREEYEQFEASGLTVEDYFADRMKKLLRDR